VFEPSGSGQVARGHHQAQAIGPGSKAIVADEYKEYRYEYNPPRPVDSTSLEEAQQWLL